MVGSPEINKAIRRQLSPVLKQCGFTRVRTRHNWGWHGPCTWVLDIRAVGNYFARVTGWPPLSVVVSLGVFYEFVPLGLPRTLELDPNGKPLPLDVDCQQRSVLHRGLDQWQHTQRLKNSAEQARTDLWWIEPDGTNVGVVVQDIEQRFLAVGLPWFERMTDIPTVYTEVKQEHDCFMKFSRAAYLAKYLARDDEYQEYRSKMENEAHRIGRAEWLAQYL